MSHEPFAAAERLAPVPPTREQATPDNWVRHYAAQGLAAFVQFEMSLPTLHGAEPGSRPDLGYLVALGVASMSAAVALTNQTPGTVQGQLWDLTPEAGALNGEWVEWLTDTLDRYGINPADIDPRYLAADFSSPASGEAATR